jgi:hypothetical protein
MPPRYAFEPCLYAKKGCNLRGLPRVYSTVQHISIRKLLTNNPSTETKTKTTTVCTWWTTIDSDRHPTQGYIIGGGGSGKGKEKERKADAPLYPQETCSNDDEVSCLLCFCCPMLQFAEYRELYVGKNFVSAEAPKLEDGKDIIQLHSEFTIRKSKDETFIRDAQKKFPDDFHSDEVLADIISRAFLSVDRGSGHVGLDYLRVTPVRDHWLENMGPDPENACLEATVKDVDELMEGWSVVKTSASLSASPPPPLPLADTVKYSWMLGGKRIPLGFTAQPLGPPSEADAEVPSETVPNA